MKAVTQQGFTFPEVLAALAIVGLVIGLIGSFASARIDAGKIHVKWTEKPVHCVAGRPRTPGRPAHR